MENMYCEISADVFMIYAIYTEKSSACRKELHIMVKKMMKADQKNTLFSSPF